MKNIKCIIADCDGTILNTMGEIDSDLLAAIRALTANNIYFTLASGRSLHLMYDIIQKLPISIPYIADNGSSIYKGDRLLSQSYIPNSYIAFIKDILIHNKVPFIIYGKSTIASYHGRPSLSFFQNHVHAPRQLISLDVQSNFRDWHDVYKIVIDTDHIVNFESISAVISRICVNMRLERSEGYLYTCSSIQSSKGKGLIQIAESLGITYDEIMVFGDNYNDISMFKLAGTAIAMDNSSDFIKAYADVICSDNNHHGVSKYIFEFLKNRNCLQVPENTNI